MMRNLHELNNHVIYMYVVVIVVVVVVVVVVCVCVCVCVQTVELMVPVLFDKYELYHSFNLKNTLKLPTEYCFALRVRICV